jgi:hypothetical protein
MAVPAAFFNTAAMLRFSRPSRQSVIVEPLVSSNPVLRVVIDGDFSQGSGSAVVAFDFRRATDGNGNDPSGPGEIAAVLAICFGVER